MNPEIIGIIAIVVLLVFMFLAMPIWVSMVVVGLAGFTILSGWTQASTVMAQSAIGALQNYAFAVLPVFLLMGELADVSRMMTDAFRSLSVWLGKLPGGLAMASVL